MGLVCEKLRGQELPLKGLTYEKVRGQELPLRGLTYEKVRGQELPWHAEHLAHTRHMSPSLADEGAW